MKNPAKSPLGQESISAIPQPKQSLPTQPLNTITPVTANLSAHPQQVD